MLFYLQQIPFFIFLLFKLSWILNHFIFLSELWSILLEIIHQLFLSICNTYGVNQCEVFLILILESLWLHEGSVPWLLWNDAMLLLFDCYRYGLSISLVKSLSPITSCAVRVRGGILANQKVIFSSNFRL